MRIRIAALLWQAFFAFCWPIAAFAQQPPVSAQEAPWNWPAPWHMWGGWGMWWIFPVIMLLMIAGCMAMVLYMHRSGGSGRNHAGSRRADPTCSAMEILNERFARGEIRREEYEDRKRAILTMTGPTGNL